MGASAGIAAGFEFHDRFNSLFVNNAIREAEELFRNDCSARRSFVEFIKSGTWAEKLDNFERVLRNFQNMESVWKKFGYADPFAAKSECCSRSCSFDSTKNSISSRTVLPSGPSGNESTRRSKISDSYSATSTWTLFADKELLAMLCFIILPFYLQSDEFRSLQDPTTSLRIRSTSSVSVRSNSVNGEDGNVQRLQDLLIGTAALYDSAELAFYLADRDHSWIEAFKAALVNLPVTLMISKIKRETKEAKVVFVNNDPSGILTSKRRTDRDKTRSFAYIAGQDMLTLCAEQLTPGGARQVEMAIFNGRTHKVSLREGGACKLRVVAPIFNDIHEHVYSVMLETPAFQNPAQLNFLGMIEQIEKPFQQIEDLLALLPLLVKM